MDKPQFSKTPFACVDVNPGCVDFGHGGHRKRMRQRVRQHGAESLSDYELVEMLLYCVIPRRDTKPLAKELLHKFGSMVGLFQASSGALTQVGLNARASALLQLPVLAAQALALSQISTRPVLGDWSALMRYLEQHQAAEVFCRVLYLDSRNQLLGDEVLSEKPLGLGTLHRAIAVQGLMLQATALILVFCAPRATAVGLAQGVRGLGLELHPFSMIVHDAVLLGYTEEREMSWSISFAQENLL